MKLQQNEKQLIQVERACGDLRRGMPVIITSENGNNLFAFSPDSLLYISSIVGNVNILDKKLIISKARANYLFPGHEFTSAVSISANNLSADEINSICSKSPFVPKVTANDLAKASETEQSALKLAKISELIPAIITFEFTGTNSGDWISVTAQAIDSYLDNSHYSMVEACHAPLTLANAENAKIIAYRPNIGGAEHYAIIIGKPGSEPLVRVHSSCYTGDLLASLTCDCRDQLQSAIELMGKGDGGIILYLMQEGRGIGLVNKLRAYELKDKGKDTVKANHALGFDDDERLFLPAAEILRKLGISSVRLLTNNPLKAAGLEEHGIKVISCVPHIMASNLHNQDYMQVKVDKMGHIANK